MFQKIIQWIRQVANRLIGVEKISDAARKDSTVSDTMGTAIDYWLDLYMGKMPWLASDNRTLNLPAAIATEVARSVTLEMKVNIAGHSGTEARAEYLNHQITPIRRNIRQYTEYACAGGGLVFKPYVDAKNLAVDLVQANSFYPVSFDSSGEITSAVFVSNKTIGRKYYTRLERHTLSDSVYTVTNEAYASYKREDIGNRCLLTDVEDWAELEPEVALKNIIAPLFSYFRIPLGNTIDPSSPLGVSVYSRAIKNIEDADKIYQGMLWEFKGGELAIDASEDLFATENGAPVLPAGSERLFRTNKLDGLAFPGGLMEHWAPALRDASYKNGLNTVLQIVELNSGLSYGIISDPAVTDKTATEIRASKQRFSATVTDIQKALESAFDSLIYAMDVYATLYKLAPKGKYETSYVWDDSIVVDSGSERAADMQEVKGGLMMPYEFRVKWYGEDEETAKAKIDEQGSKKDPFNLQ